MGSEFFQISCREIGHGIEQYDGFYLLSPTHHMIAQDKIAKDPKTHGAMFLPLIMGSDKTTVSVATGNQEFHPFYGSPGIISNLA
jgi:Plavaka transposase